MTEGKQNKIIQWVPPNSIILTCTYTQYVIYMISYHETNLVHLNINSIKENIFLKVQSVLQYPWTSLVNNIHALLVSVNFLIKILFTRILPSGLRNKFMLFKINKPNQWSKRKAKKFELHIIVLIIKHALLFRVCQSRLLTLNINHSYKLTRKREH